MSQTSLKPTLRCGWQLRSGCGERPPAAVLTLSSIEQPLALGERCWPERRLDKVLLPLDTDKEVSAAPVTASLSIELAGGERQSLRLFTSHASSVPMKRQQHNNSKENLQMADVEGGIPEWTEQDESQGLDPLGMQNTSIALYQWLLPGISNVTLRMRYYALHTWLTAEYARAQHSADVEEWCRFLRRSEALYALIVHHNTQDSGVAGTRWARRKLDLLKGDLVLFSENTDRQNNSQYLKQKFGAFGAAYSSQLVELGLIEEAQGHSIPLASRTSGQALAFTFATEIQAFGYQFLQAVQDGSVSLEGLSQMGPMAPSSIAEDSTERQMYEQILFAPGAPADSRAARRRATLRLVLHTAQELQRPPGPDDVRWASYSGFDDDGEPLPALHGADADHRYRWRVYHANDMLHVCHESLLRFALEVLSEFPGGIALDALLREVVGRLLAVPEQVPSTWADLEDSVTVQDNAWSEEADAEWLLVEALLGVRIEAPFTASIAYQALKLLAVLSKRLRPECDQIARVLMPARHDTSQTIFTEPHFLWTRKGLPIEQALAQLIRKRVLDRHLSVAFQKMRAGDYTFLFEVDEGRLRFRQKAGPVLTNPRLGPAIQFLHDIHLLKVDGITHAGLRVAGYA